MANFDIKQLPKSVLAKAKSTLHAYPSVHIWYNAQHNDYRVITGTMLSAHDDGYRHVVSLSQNDLFTHVERIENYINTFCSYPTAYEGKKERGIIQRMQNEREQTPQGIRRPVGKIDRKTGDFKLTGHTVDKY